MYVYYGIISCISVNNKIEILYILLLQYLRNCRSALIHECIVIVSIETRRIVVRIIIFFVYIMNLNNPQNKGVSQYISSQSTN